jgi:methylmalonyl-CoA mutase
MTEHLPFMAAFPPGDEAQWRAAVEKVLKGADFEKKLVGRTADGIPVRPLYPKAEGGITTGKNAGQRWRICARVDHPNLEEAVKLALADLEGGADALVLVPAGSLSARGFGLAVDDLRDLDIALENVAVELIHLRIDPAPTGIDLAKHLGALVERRGLDPALMDIDFGLDPLGVAAHLGISPNLDEAVAQALALRDTGFTGPCFTADGRPYHEAGATEGQELGAILATLVTYLRALEAGGMPLGAARGFVSATLTVDANQFLSMAKVRALRRLWASVESACGLEPRPLAIHAETSWRMMTRRDPWVNMLRATIATFAAGVGGADGLTVLPFTAALGLPDGFARRVARNTQSVLQEEANLWRVVDPAAGSGGLEALTEGLCERGWKLFQDIEREGGIAAALANGHIAKGLAREREALQKAVATRKITLTGTSEFPNLAELPVTVLQSPPPVDAAAHAHAHGLPSFRLAEPFEALRDKAEQTATTIFLATLGSAAAFSSRAGFAANLFAAGGIRTLETSGFGEGDGTDLVAMTDAFKESGARLACICGTDEAYASEAADAAMALGASGATAIYLAGRPGDLEPALRAAGVTGFIHAGCDVIGCLTEILEAAP